MSSSHGQGGSIVRREASDICFLRFVGDISPEEMRRLTTEARDLIASGRCAFLLVDVSRVGQVTAEARAAASAVATEKAATAGVSPIAVFGASFQVRVLATLVHKANALIRRSTPRPIDFFGTEAEARAWLDELRLGSEGTFLRAGGAGARLT